ncbi:DNA-binding protein [Romboutsia ilealis]|uniref:DNA-binding protein n=1 Tax=Romboutsia ilealis TaxID=1115758 RepID=UPI0025745C8D|nr:DNA-binding protein [Romboutsia ilealis]
MINKDINIRMSLTIPKDLNVKLELIAKNKKRSVNNLIVYALDRYVENQLNNVNNNFSDYNLE